MRKRLNMSHDSSRPARHDSGWWRAWVRFLLGVALVTGCFTSAGAAPASTNLPPLTSTLPDASFSVIRVFGALALVLALFLVGVWVFKNWQRLALQRGRASQLQLIEVKPLGGKHVLYVVGYQQQRLLLAASPAGVSLVSHLPEADPAELEAGPGGPVSNPNFVQALQQAVQGKS
jgi:flagellar biogenesis protein FliO